jgi:FkbM family methyltransferase
MLSDTLKGIVGYFSLFGFYGIFMATKARLLKINPIISGTVPSSAFPVFLRVRTTDISTYESILLGREYELPFAFDPRIIIDAGANIGMASVFFAIKFPKAKIIAVEPESSNYELLVKNTSPYPNITAVRAALWRNNQEVSVCDAGSGHWGRTISDNGGFERCRALTMDRLMAEHDLDCIDLLKIDIEGAEKEVFENADGWIHKINMIAGELHDHIKAGCSSAFTNATSEFNTICQKGETIFKIRKGIL